MNVKLRLLGLMLGASLFGAGCVTESTPEMGGETHWLQSCDSDAECGSELSCACGICTVDCTSDSSCDAVAEGGRCISSADADLAMKCESSAPAQLCVSLQAGNSADDSNTDDSTSDTATDAGGGTDLVEVRGGRYDVDADCFGADETAGTRSTQGELGCDDALTRALDAEGTCWLFPSSCIPDDFTALGAPQMGPIALACNMTERRCAGSQPEACSDALVLSDGECLSCEEARSRTNVALGELASDPALLECEIDADCTIASTETSCNGTCGAVASLATLDKFAEGVEDVSERFCSDPNWETRCGFATPDCEQVVYSCQEGQCVRGAKPACVAQGGCDSPLNCFAETCVAGCMDSADCASEERCVYEEAETCSLAVVDPSAPRAGVCLTRCRNDDECASAGDDMSCWTNYCLAQLPACELSCPKVATECDPTCGSITGHAYRPDDACRDTQEVVLGCVPGGRPTTDDDTCVVSPDGLVFPGLSGSYSSQLIANGGYVECTEEQVNAASEALPCE